jgi:hypothetical protein
MDAMPGLAGFGDFPVAVLPHMPALTETTTYAAYLISRSFRFH